MSRVTQEAWDDEMVDPSSGLQRDDLIDLQFEEESREMAAQMQEVPSWSSLFFEHSEWGGPAFKCGTSWLC